MNIERGDNNDPSNAHNSCNIMYCKCGNTETKHTKSLMVMYGIVLDWLVCRGNYENLVKKVRKMRDRSEYRIIKNDMVVEFLSNLH